MKYGKPTISPAEVRAIRESLGLSQTQAGEILGGGPRAFSKYECGVVTPAASVVRLLRILEADPGALRRLGDQATPPVADSRPSPVETSGSHVSELTERTLPKLLRRLLNTEARSLGIPLSGVHVSGAITTADGGEDGRIEWTEGPSQTDYLPARLCQFQLKTGGVTPAKAANEVRTKSGSVKAMVREAIEQGGVYIVLCARSYTQRQIADRVRRIFDALRASGLSVRDDQVEFRDADQIADWVNQYPSVATWLLEEVEPGLLGPFRSWANWAGRHEHQASPYVPDKRMGRLATYLRETIDKPGGIARVVGRSGIGMSRLTLEALGAIKNRTIALKDSVLYAVESESGPVDVRRAVQNLADCGKRAVVVVDDCTTETRRHVASMAQRASSQLSLVTIENEVPDGRTPKQALSVSGAPASVVEGIVRREAPELPEWDQRRVARFSEGFPKIAMLVCAARKANEPLAHATESDLVDRFVLGSESHERDMILRTARLLAVFWAVRYSDSGSDWGHEISSLGRGLSAEDFHAALGELVRRGVAKRNGRNIAIWPRPIALRLAERQWEDWQPARWDQVLAGAASPDSRIMAARQLALLNTTEIATRVVEHVCRPNGCLVGWSGVSRTGNAQLLCSLAEVCPDIVAALVERALSEVELDSVRDDTRRDIVRALEKIAFDRETFVVGARLLLRLATHENESWANNATGQFSALFPVVLGNTAAGAEERLAMLGEAADSKDPIQLCVVVKALIKGIQTDHFSREVGPEVRGAGRALESWRPPTHEAARDYVRQCATRLGAIALRADEVGAAARIGVFDQFRSMVGFGLIDTVERIVAEVRDRLQAPWPEATESLRHFIAYDADQLGDDELSARVQALIESFQPRTVEDRLKFLVKEMPWDYPSEERLEPEELDTRQSMEVEGLARSLARDPCELKRHFQMLCQGEQRKTGHFGFSVAKYVRDPLALLNSIKAAIAQVPKDDRNYSLLVGFLEGIANKGTDATETIAALKQEAAESPILAPALPLISGRLGVTDSDVALVISALRFKHLSPTMLFQWLAGSALTRASEDSVAELFDFLLDRDAESYTVCVELLSTFSRGGGDPLNRHRRHILRVAENIGNWPIPAHTSYGFKLVMRWLLSKGRDDADACELALILATRLRSPDDRSTERVIEPLLPSLLKDFPEITWPVLGQEIVSNKKRAWQLEFMLGTPNVRGRKDPAILQLPESTMIAWCRANPAEAPPFLAAVLPIFADDQGGTTSRLHPLARRLIDEFGDCDRVLDGFARNMLTISYVGSLAPYFSRYQPIFEELLRHPRLSVRLWSKRGLRQLETLIEDAKADDAEFESESQL